MPRFLEAHPMNEYNIESALDVIETWIKISGHPYRHEVSYTRHSYVIQHDMGMNWSLYMAEQYRFLFEEFELKKVIRKWESNVNGLWKLKKQLLKVNDSKQR